MRNKRCVSGSELLQICMKEANLDPSEFDDTKGYEVKLSLKSIFSDRDELKLLAPVFYIECEHIYAKSEKEALERLYYENIHSPESFYVTEHEYSIYKNEYIIYFPMLMGVEKQKDGSFITTEITIHKNEDYYI